MKHRQIQLFADKKHYRALQKRLREEVQEIMRRQKPKWEPRMAVGCVWP